MGALLMQVQGARMTNTEILNELRRLRIDAAYHRDKAANYLNRATKGMSNKVAVNRCGNGDCPVTAYTEIYSKEHASTINSSNKANAIWAQIRPRLEAYDHDTRCVIELYYNQAAEMRDVARAVKRSLAACEKMQAGVCLTMDVPCFPKPSICRQRFKEIG